jgi:hypothetical protein
VDILQEEGSGIWHFRFTEDSEADARVKKSIKNNQSVRRVPVHPKLIADGFLEFVMKQRKGGNKLLFPAWTPTRRRASPAAEKWFRVGEDRRDRLDSQAITRSRREIPAPREAQMAREKV